MDLTTESRRSSKRLHYKSAADGVSSSSSARKEAMEPMEMDPADSRICLRSNDEDSDTTQEIFFLRLQAATVGDRELRCRPHRALSSIRQSLTGEPWRTGNSRWKRRSLLSNLRSGASSAPDSRQASGASQSTKASSVIVRASALLRSSPSKLGG